MSIRLLTNKDKELLEEFLSPHKSECMFILNNISIAGLEYEDKPFHGEYWGYFHEKSQLFRGVIVHYWNGNIMMFSPDEGILHELILALKENISRPVEGILGTNSQAEIVINHLKLLEENYSINYKEELFELELKNFVEYTPIKNSYAVTAKEVSRGILINWMNAYEAEALGVEENSHLRKKTEECVDRLVRGDCWVLIVNNIPVSLSAFNARIKGLVQVGPVWTPPEFRNQGFAKAVVGYSLWEERKKQTEKVILFTNEPAAIKVYRALGFEKIGYYRLALLNKPIFLGKSF